jgi:hypothetical protein
VNTSYENQRTDMDDRIDRTLRLLGSAEPRPGLEKRIAARLAHAPVQTPARFLVLPRFAVGAAGVLACAGIIAGSVSHSRHLLPIAPGVQLQRNMDSGLGTAAAQKVAPKPVTPPLHGRARSMRKTGPGAAGLTDVQKPDGVAVPKAPLPQNDASPQ